MRDPGEEPHDKTTMVQHNLVVISFISSLHNISPSRVDRIDWTRNELSKQLLSIIRRSVVFIAITQIS